MALPDLSIWAVTGAEIAVRVTPNARHDALEVAELPGSSQPVGDKPELVRIWVTVVPENGRATAAAQALLAKAMGVAKSRLTLVRGVKSRDKPFRFE